MFLSSVFKRLERPKMLEKLERLVSYINNNQFEYIENKRGEVGFLLFKLMKSLENPNPQLS
ncbi:MAG: hypothetical protein PHQ18_05420 [Patescibacteria group bacterium]|nr:hypothetical protein [Patescibacteria group bacterium]